MKPAFILPILAGGALAGSAPATDMDAILSEVSQLPKCSRQCLVDGSKEHGCGVADFVCQCTKTAEITATVSPCMVHAGCSMEDLGAVAKIIGNICKHLDAQGKINIVPASSVKPSDQPGAAARGTSAGRTGIAVVAAIAALL